MHRLDVARDRRVRLELAAQVLHVRIDRALVAVVVVALDAVDELEAREDATGRAGEREQQLELRRRELDRLALDDRLVALGVDAQPAGVEAQDRLGGGAALAGPAQER